MHNSREANLRVWNDEYSWPEDGDEWKGQAQLCGVPYLEWKAAVVEYLLAPAILPGATVLEIGPGHGRWTAEILPRCGRAILVDLSSSCLEHYRRRFSGFDRVEYHLGDGQSLSGVEPNGVDFAWSFDVFVHIERVSFCGYLQELGRVLRPGGSAVLHHAGRRHWALGLSFLRDRGTRGRRFYQWLSMGRMHDDDGWRSDISAWLVRSMARHAGLRVIRQMRWWGSNRRYGVPRYGDWISLLERPAG
ncbi:MAG: class I SAM-dependent methyltransferase [Methylacidiphilaceae bacterium]|nr:class I SAM-dependent methyltransferase [Candidatus Methylacidiphilaceae bacterium]